MRMPVLFLAHGSPMNAIESNRFTDDWHALAKNIPTPKAIVVFSAHWFIGQTLVQRQAKQNTQHDFFGFPEALNQCQYNPPGAPKLAQSLSNTLNKAGFYAQAKNAFGLDHGSWSVLTHLYPKANIPTLQISLNASQKDLSWHFNLAKTLQEYREQGVLFIGSGNIVHNIAKWMQSRPSDPIDWAKDFDSKVYEALVKRDWQALFSYQNLPFAQDSVPTVEHFLPLIYCAGLSSNDDVLATSNFKKQDLGAYSSRSIRFG